MLDLFFLIVFAMAHPNVVQQTPIGAFQTLAECEQMQQQVLQREDFVSEAAKTNRVVVLCTQAVNPFTSANKYSS